MPREPQIFESAITTNDFSSDDYCGTTYAAKLLGLSVATVQSLVEKGEIEAWKTLGGHRRLSLRAINVYLQKNSPQLAPVDPDRRSRLSVLVVEDEEETRELYRAQFDEWDMAVDCSFMPSALEALIDIASMQPDLLITDLNMPGVDGMEMLRALKRNQQLLAMQILVISGLPKEAIQERGGFRRTRTILKSRSISTGCMVTSPPCWWLTENGADTAPLRVLSGVSRCRSRHG